MSEPAHLCPNASIWFDRQICPPPCDMMHYRCTGCGRAFDACPHEQQDTRIAAAIANEAQLDENLRTVACLTAEIRRTRWRIFRNAILCRLAVRILNENSRIIEVTRELSHGAAATPERRASVWHDPALDDLTILRYGIARSAAAAFRLAWQQNMIACIIWISLWLLLAVLLAV